MTAFLLLAPHDGHLAGALLEDVEGVPAHKLAAPTSSGGWVALGCRCGACGDVWQRQRPLLRFEAAA